VFNVGDIKPLEVPLTFAMALAWDINSIRATDLPQFFNTMAKREFGQEIDQRIGALWHQYNRLVSMRRHEHIEPDTFSLLNYNEADTILKRWKALLSEAEAIEQQVLAAQRPSLFELVVHPIKASYIFIALQISLGRNRLYALQRRNSANKLAQQVLELFDDDFRLSEDFHTLLNGKWNHIMMQPHYGFGDTWHAPSRDMISGLSYVQRRQNSNPIFGQMGIAVEGHGGVRPGRCNEASDSTHPSKRDLVPGVTLGTMTRYGPKSRWFDIYTRGGSVINWTTSTHYSWINLPAASGQLVPGEDDLRMEVTVDWEQVPTNFSEEVLIDVRSAEGDFEQIHLPIIGREVPDTFSSGFVEGDGYISIPASASVMNAPYRVLPDLGRSDVGSVAVDPTLGPSLTYLAYDVYVFTQTPKVDLLLYFNMTLDLDPNELMNYDVLIDGNALQTHRLVTELSKVGELPNAEGWTSAVQDCAWIKRHTFSGEYFNPGKHDIKLRLRSSNLTLEKIVVDLGGVKESYLGPPPSIPMEKRSSIL
jgi:hypothetical protein